MLGQLRDEPCKILAAGRTDRGVHATGQVASALIPARFEVGELKRALNALAPDDLWIASAERVALDFHPRYDAVSRTYRYRLGVRPEARSPFLAPWCWPLGRPLDLERMRVASRDLLGQHDFGAFAKSGQPERGVSCRVLSAEWYTIDAGLLEFEITADRFLHHMVRYIVGTLAEIGLERRPATEMAGLLRGDPGGRVAPPAPAHGLWLTRVEYPEDVIEAEC